MSRICVLYRLDTVLAIISMFTLISVQNKMTTFLVIFLKCMRKDYIDIYIDTLYIHNRMFNVQS